MSGAAVADAGGLGNIEIKAMKDAKYDTDFSVGITKAASSIIGPIIPPSLLVIYGVTKLYLLVNFFVGIIPGLLMAVSLMITSLHIMLEEVSKEIKVSSGLG